jgi:hypothetical protein
MWGKVEQYPTEGTDDAYKGSHAAFLQTHKGGSYMGFHIPVFSGSLFTGKLVINAGNFAKSPQFGQPQPKEKGKPIRFEGYYKYKEGSEFLMLSADGKSDSIAIGRIDECSIYSVLYKTKKGSNGTSKEEHLDGTNVMTSDKVIAKAILEDGSAKDKYTHFSIPFQYTEEPDYDSFDYKLAIVFASSKEGDFYRGAIGSTLIVDEVEVICETYDKIDGNKR